jgi:hypothetical protein
VVLVLPNFQNIGIRDHLPLVSVIKLFLQRSRRVYIASLLAKTICSAEEAFTIHWVDNVEAFLQMEFNLRISQKTFFTYRTSNCACFRYFGTDILSSLDWFF